MKSFIIVFCIIGVEFARASAPFLAVPIAYAKLQPGAPIGLDGKVIDTPEVAYAKAEHAAAHINERLNHAARASDDVIIESGNIARYESAGAAPIGLDGRVVDTPEVAFAKAEHSAAHLNEKLRSGSAVISTAPIPLVASAPAAVISPLPILAKYQAGAPIGLDGRVVDTPEVASAKAEHAAAHLNEKLKSSSAVVSSAPIALVRSAPAVINSAPIFARYQAGAPIGLDGRVLDTPEVAYAKAEHAAAHLNARFDHAAESFRNAAAANYVHYVTPYYQYYF